MSPDSFSPCSPDASPQGIGIRGPPWPFPPACLAICCMASSNFCSCSRACSSPRSEEHTSELQSQFHLVCRLLLEKKKQQTKQNIRPSTSRNNHIRARSII